MRRITLWITATLAATALLFAFQANLSGTTGKSDDSRHPATSSAPAEPGDSTPGDGQHVDKPGENK